MRRRRFLVAMGAAAVGMAGRPRLGRAADRGPIRIGYFGPLTGNFSQTGKDMTDGFTLFWEEVGYKVAGREVKVIVEDSDPEPTGALTKVRRLVEQENVHTVAGGLLAATGYAIAPYLEQNKIPTVYPVMAPDDITQRKPVRWVVRTSFTGSQATHPLGDYAYKQLKLRRMATISMDYAFGWESNGGFQRVFEDLGGKVVQRIWTPLNMQDYAPYLTSLKKDIDGVYACHTGGLSPRFVKAWSDAGLKGKIPLVGIGTLTDENVLKSMGDEAVGVMTSLIYSSVLENPANKKFSAAYEKRYGRGTSLYSAEGYTAGRFYYEALRSINGEAEDKEKLLAALRKVEFSDEPRGPMKMDDLGNPIQNVYIRRVERVGGKLQNSVIYTYPNVSQFWTYNRDEYLKTPVYDRNYPPCKYCE
ncbi:MAG TPA: ABC transporter substrate-binding protein [Methylomirabilota bacterium]|nr:ABC transporter substrate-binding protein [Methylomirabilota bacterium]